uniref:Uncharacterized protein n=1 Tax=viral metagenome TaxID=1070528 RepID=A0A6M3J400_9ZZZZ
MSITRITRDELLAIACKHWGAEVSLSVQSVPKMGRDKHEIIVPVTIYDIKFESKEQKEEFETQFTKFFEVPGKSGGTFKECFNQLVLERRTAFKQYHQGDKQDDSTG